jgi:acetylornithine deacetylase/succinyl-diaminopimelate desuccinylase-like protein
MTTAARATVIRGISHAPAEHADTDDCVAGLQALADALAALL